MIEDFLNQIIRALAPQWNPILSEDPLFHLEASMTISNHLGYGLDWRRPRRHPDGGLNDLNDRPTVYWSIGVFGRPFAADPDGILFVVLVMLCDVVGKWIVLGGRKPNCVVGLWKRTGWVEGDQSTILTGFGAERSACMERRTVRIWRAGDHLS